MKSKKSLLKKSRLYVILDKKTLGRRPLSTTVKKVLNSGADMIQLRDKVSEKESILRNAQELNKQLLNTKTLFIINNHVDIAKIVNSDGVHLGQRDLSVATARRVLGKDKVIGVSCHNLEQARKAENQGADYLSIGPLFRTPTKPGYMATGLGLIKEVKEKIKIPFFAIGGIDENNILKVLSSGAKRVVVCRAACQAKDISSAMKNLSSLLRLSR